MQKKYCYSLYMVGNYEFASHVKRDLHHKLGGHYTRGSNANMDIVCYASYYRYAKLHNYIYYGKGKHQIPFANEQQIDKMDINKFMSFVKKNFNTKHYVLTLWGHTYTWMWFLPFYNREILNKKKIFDHKNPEKAFKKKSFDYFDIFDLKKALTKNKFDILVFETCAGMSLETIYELRNKTKYIVGNCDYTSYEGIAHRKIIQCSKQPKNFCQEIVNHMPVELCPSCIQTQKINFIKRKLKNFVYLILKKINQKKLKNIISRIPKNIVDDLTADLGCLLHHLILNTDSNQIKLYANILILYMKENIFCKQRGRFKKNNCCGINIFLPRNKEDYLEYKSKYKKLEFNKNNNWIEFLDRIH
jgi:Clostripain family